MGDPLALRRIKLRQHGGADAEDAEARFELRCVECGYAAVVLVAPEACPMCRATVWEFVRSRSTEEVSPKAHPADMIEHLSSADREQRYVQLVSISVTERRA
jgi:hypothetical protein